MPNQSGKVVLLLVLFLLLLGVFAYFLSPFFKGNNYTKQTLIYSPNPGMNNKEANPTSAEMKEYYSKALKINFITPKEARIEEKFINIAISLPDGDISVTRNGTNFESAKEYYNDLKEKNKLAPTKVLDGVIGKYNYFLVFDEDPDDKSKDEKIYFIYADYAVYIFSTADEALYPVLDQIVQSFEYKP